MYHNIVCEVNYVSDEFTPPRVLKFSCVRKTVENGLDVKEAVEKVTDYVTALLNNDDDYITWSDIRSNSSITLRREDIRSVIVESRPMIEGV